MADLPRRSRWRQTASSDSSNIERWTERPKAPEPTKPTMKNLGAGDSYLIPAFLNDRDADAALAALSPLKLGGEAEVAWMQMYGANGKPFGRLKFTQATLDEGLEPIYRYPTNNQAACATQPWSSTVRSLKEKVEACIGQTLNHCVGNLYQNEHDFIGPHTDKMLDILEGSCIVSLSLGAERPIVLERKSDGVVQKVHLPHGSLFVLGPATNREWMHSIPAQAHQLGHRISLTIRQMGTFFDTVAKRLIGQGARKPGLNWPDWQHDVTVQPEVIHPRANFLKQELSASSREGGSSFECFIRPCRTLTEAEEGWSELWARFPEACHIPYAWALHHDSPASAGERSRSHCNTGSYSDREPVSKWTDTGADGLLAPLLKSGLLDCVVYVVRHWDGVKLGASRLIHAYYAAVEQALQQHAHCIEPTPGDAAEEKAHSSSRQDGNERADDVERQIRKLKKALREISLLQEAQAAGQALQQNQIWKLQRRGEYETQLASLQGSAMPDGKA